MKGKFLEEERLHERVEGLEEDQELIENLINTVEKAVKMTEQISKDFNEMQEETLKLRGDLENLLERDIFWRSWQGEKLERKRWVRVKGNFYFIK